MQFWNAYPSILFNEGGNITSSSKVQLEKFTFVQTVIGKIISHRKYYSLMKYIFIKVHTILH